MITLDQIKQLMTRKTRGQYCVEMLFSIKGSKKYNHCWMGVMPDRDTGDDIYWFGLTADGKNAFDYSTFEELSSAKVFDGKSLSEIWESVTVEEIDGCEPMARLVDYIGENK